MRQYYEEGLLSSGDELQDRGPFEDEDESETYPEPEEVEAPPDKTDIGYPRPERPPRHKRVDIESEGIN